MTHKSKGISAPIFVCLTFAPLLGAMPRLSLNTNTIGSVNIAPGTNGSATVQATNIGDGTLNLTAGASAPCLSATVGAQGSCSNPGGSCYAVSIALNSGTLAPGTYTEYITLSDPNAIDSPQSIAVTVNTASGVPPSITAYVMPYGSPSASAIFPVITA